MDQTRSNILGLFDEALCVLNKHGKREGAVEALEYFRIARYNYEQRDIDRMLLCLVLAVNQLRRLPPEVLQELEELVAGFVQVRAKVSDRMTKLAQKYEARGGKLLSLDEVLEEVGRRRGSSD